MEANKTSTDILKQVTTQKDSAAASSPTVLSSATQKDKPKSTVTRGARKAMYYLIQQKGLSAVNAAAIVGNLQQESTINVDPKAGKLEPGSAGGVYQLRGERQAAFLAYAKRMKKSPESLFVQLDYLVDELRRVRRASMESQDTFTQEEQMSIGSLEDRTYLFNKKFERAGEARDSAQNKKREAYAQALYADLKAGVALDDAFGIGLDNDEIPAFAYKVGTTLADSDAYEYLKASTPLPWWDNAEALPALGNDPYSDAKTWTKPPIDRFYVLPSDADAFLKKVPETWGTEVPAHLADYINKQREKK